MQPSASLPLQTHATHTLTCVMCHGRQKDNTKPLLPLPSSTGPSHNPLPWHCAHCTSGPPAPNARGIEGLTGTANPSPSSTTARSSRTCAATGCTVQFVHNEPFCSGGCQDYELSQLIKSGLSFADRPNLFKLPSTSVLIPLSPEPDQPLLPSSPEPVLAPLTAGSTTGTSFDLANKTRSAASLALKASGPPTPAVSATSTAKSPLQCPVPDCTEPSYNDVEGECCSKKCKADFIVLYESCKCKNWSCLQILTKSPTQPAFCSQDCQRQHQWICSASECSEPAAPGHHTCTLGSYDACNATTTSELFKPVSNCEDKSFVPKRTTGESFRSTPSTITFHLSCDYLSNWFNFPILIDGKVFTCNEQYMMAYKATLFNDPESYHLIMNTADPAEHKRLGRSVRNFVAESWNIHSVKAVLRANLAKFGQNAHLGRLLLNTGNKILVEASPFDKIWGAGCGSYADEAQAPASWRGKNLLGHVLMQVRKTLRWYKSRGSKISSLTGPFWPLDPANIKEQPLPPCFCKNPGCRTATWTKGQFCSSRCKQTAAGLTGPPPANTDQCAVNNCSKPRYKGSEACGRAHRDHLRKMSVMTTNAAVPQLCDGNQCNRIRHPGGRFCSLRCRSNNLNLPERVQLSPESVSEARQGYYESTLDYFDRIRTSACRCPAPCKSQRELRCQPSAGFGFFICSSWKNFWDSGADNCFGLGCTNKPISQSFFCSVPCRISRGRAECAKPGCTKDTFPDKPCCTWSCEDNIAQTPIACSHYPSCNLLAATGSDKCTPCDQEAPSSTQSHAAGSISCDACAPTSAYVSPKSTPVKAQSNRHGSSATRSAPLHWADALSPADLGPDATVMPIHRHSPGPTERPIVTSQLSWPAAICYSPQGAFEMPSAIPTPAAQDEAHGVSNQRISELDHVTQSQYMPLMNMPVTRGPSLPPPPQLLNTSPDYPEGWLPTKGSFSALFTEFEFNAEDHGKFVHTYYVSNKSQLRGCHRMDNVAAPTSANPAPIRVARGLSICDLPGCSSPPHRRLVPELYPGRDPRPSHYCSKAHAESHEASLKQAGQPLPVYAEEPNRGAARHAVPRARSTDAPKTPKVQRRFKITLSPDQIVDMICEWTKCNNKDATQALKMVTAKKSKANLPTKFRPRCKDLFIPQEAMQLGARGIIWDTEEYFRTEPQARKEVQIRPLDVTEPMIHPWNTSKLAEWAFQSQCPDHKLISELCGPGVAPPFTGSMTATLCANSQSYFDNIEACISKTKEEIDMGFIAKPLPNGVPCFPIKVFKMGAALQFKKGGVVKTRTIGSLSAPYGDHEHLSANAGFNIDTDLETWPKLDYCSSARIAAYCAVVATACEPGDFVFLAVDWRYFYRQMLRAKFGLWLQAGCGTGEGIAIDLRWIFGGANCCHEANAVENILIYLIIFRLMVSWHLDMENPASWIDQVIRSRPWLTDRNKAWILNRVALFGLPGSTQAKARDRGHIYGRPDEISDFCNLIPAFLQHSRFPTSQTQSALFLP